jgi:hypothetical protein
VQNQERVYVAALSTTVCPIDGTYEVKTIEKNESVNLTDVPHYIGHPDTKAIVELLGAVPAPTKLFTGLEVGQSAICFAIKQGRSTRTTEGFTIHQAVESEDLDVRRITRVI